MKVGETRDWYFVDKSKWGYGPWQNEPDKIQWLDEATGMPCLIVRSQSGALCGYAGVSSGHPMFEVGYGGSGWEDESSPAARLEVHGGLTFSGHCSEDERGICHVVSAGEDDHVWWFGFDCAHFRDACPGYPGVDGIYRDVAYVQSQVRDLAAQLAAAVK